MRTNIAFILLLIAASQATILRQKKVGQRVEGAIYSQNKPLGNGQTLKTTLLQLVDDGEGNDGYEITMSIGNKDKAPVKVTAQQLADIVKNDFDVEIEPLFFENCAEALNAKHDIVTFTWLKEASSKDLAKKHKVQLNYKTGNVNDQVEPVYLTAENQGFIGNTPAEAPKILKYHPDVKAMIDLGPGRFLEATAHYEFNEDNGDETWNFDFKIIGKKNSGRNVNGDDICKWIKEEVKEKIESEQCDQLASQLNEPKNGGAGFAFTKSAPIVVRAPQLVSEAHRQMVDSNGVSYDYDFTEKLWKDENGNWFDDEMNPVMPAIKLPEAQMSKIGDDGKVYEYDFTNKVFVDENGDWFTEKLMPIHKSGPQVEAIRAMVDGNGKHYDWDFKNKVWVDKDGNWFTEDLKPLQKPLPAIEPVLKKKVAGQVQTIHLDEPVQMIKLPQTEAYTAHKIKLDEPVQMIKLPQTEAYTAHKVHLDEPVQMIKLPQTEADIVHKVHLDEPVQVIKMPKKEAYTANKVQVIHMEGPVIAAQETRRPEPVGHQEFENAAKMRFCIEGLSKAGAFKENAFDDIGLAHRRVNRFNRYEDFPGMPTCYIQFEFERPEICAFSSKIVNGEIQYTLRGDSGASCSKFLTGKGYITEDKPINVKYELENPDHLSLREEQSMLIGEFIDLLKDSEAINKGYTLDVSDFTKISKTFGRYNQYTATFTHNNKNCHLIQNKYSDYMAKFELTVDSATDCSQVIKALDKQHGVFGHNGGNWQKAAADALGLAVGELNDNKLIKSDIKFTAKDLVNVKETMLDSVDMVDITVFKNGNQCQFKAKFTPDGETSWTNQSTEAACNALVNGGKFRL